MRSRLVFAARTIVETWARWVSVAVGVWLMAAPAILGYGDAAATVHRLVGPVAASFAFVAVWGHMRGLRWANVPLGAVLLLAPWPLGFGPAATVNSLVIGLALVALGLVGGPIHERYGGGWGVLWRGSGRG